MCVSAPIPVRRVSSLYQGVLHANSRNAAERARERESPGR